MPDMPPKVQPALDAAPVPAALNPFLDRALFQFESAVVAALLIIALVRPTTGSMGLPSWALLLLFAAYRLVVELIRRRVPRLHAYAWKSILDIPVTALLFFVSREQGGPLLVLMFLAVACAAISLTLRSSLIYTGVVAVLIAVIDFQFLMQSPTPGNIREVGTTLVMLGLFGAGTALLRQRLVLEQAAARSERDEAERLEELERLRAEFISTVSHELQTPLTAARAGLGLLETSAWEQLRSAERDLLGNARRNVERLGLHIDALLAYNQLATGTLRLEREPLDLRAVVMGAMAAVHPLLREKQQMLEIELPEPLLLNGDMRRLEQVIVNLLANAHRHTPPSTRIRVTGQVTATEVRVSVSDNGPGIPRDELPGIFERSHHFTAAEGGSGLGLTISRSIVEMHGGRIRAESEVGQGVAFHITLPHVSQGVQA